MLQARLGELARLVVPDLHGLLDIPAVVAYAPVGGGGQSTSGWLYIGRIDRNAPPALALARALNLVRASGREVEIELLPLGLAWRPRGGGRPRRARRPAASPTRCWPIG